MSSLALKIAKTIHIYLSTESLKPFLHKTLEIRRLVDWTTFDVVQMGYWIGILRTRRDPSAPLMHHFHGGRCVIILGFEIFAKFWFTLESWIRNIPRYCVHGPRLSCNSCYVHLCGATLLHLSSLMSETLLRLRPLHNTCVQSTGYVRVCLVKYKINL